MGIGGAVPEGNASSFEQIGAGLHERGHGAALQGGQGGVAGHSVAACAVAACVAAGVVLAWRFRFSRVRR